MRFRVTISQKTKKRNCSPEPSEPEGWAKTVEQESYPLNVENVSLLDEFPSGGRAISRGEIPFPKGLQEDIISCSIFHVFARNSFSVIIDSNCNILTLAHYLFPVKSIIIIASATSNL